jgi:hypothetical protein
LARGKHVFAADGAIVFVLVLETVVCIEHADRDAHAALLAMLKGFDTADSTEAALNAMKWFFRTCHPQVAYVAMIFTKASPTMHAKITESRLEG